MSIVLSQRGSGSRWIAGVVLAMVSAGLGGCGASQSLGGLMAQLPGGAGVAGAASTGPETARATANGPTTNGSTTAPAAVATATINKPVDAAPGASNSNPGKTGAASTASAAGAAGAPVASGIGSIGLTVAGSRIEVYEYLARRALSCWLGADGPLKGTHVFGAEVPAGKGSDGTSAGAAEISIYERDERQSASRGLRAYRVTLESAGESLTRVDTANSRMPADLATAMGRDVEAWSRRVEGCFAQSARPPAQAVSPPAAPAKQSKKDGQKANKPAALRSAG